MRRKLIGLALGISSLSIFAANPAGAVVGAAVPGSFQAGFATPRMVVPVGQQFTFANGDAYPHDITSVKKKADGKTPLFQTATVNLGGTATAKAPTVAGDYDFICSVHPNMKGVLTAV